MIAAHDTQALADRAIVATYEKLHAGKLGAHWLWCVIEQIAAGVPEAQAFKSFGYYEAGPSRARWDASRLQKQEGQPALSDERILHLWDTHVGDPTEKLPLTRADKIAFARATLAAGSQAVHVPGWKMMPVEPTEAMHVAAVRTIIRCTGNADFPPRVWRAMLNAAPLQPLAGGEVGK